MNRTWSIWLILIVCALSIVGAMGWLTQRTLRMEQERLVSEAEASVEERVRLALSRMDAAAAAMLVIENQRPPEHYQSFFWPSGLFTNTLQPVRDDLVTQPSPLLADPPEFIRLHFEITEDGRLISPQVPSDSRRDLAEAAGVSAQEITSASQQLDKLADLLGLKQDPSGGDKDQTGGVGRISKLAEQQANAPGWNVPPGKEVAAPVVQTNEALLEDVANQYANPQDNQIYQQKLTQADRGRRLVAYQDANNRAVESVVKKGSMSKSISDYAKQRDQVQSEEHAKRQLGEASAGADSDALLSQVAGSIGSGDVAVREEAEDQIARSPSSSQALSQAAGEPLVVLEKDFEITPLQALWLGDELLAVREVKSESGTRLQGFWLDAEGLRGSLLGGISDLLPEALLVPIKVTQSADLSERLQRGESKVQNDSRSLVTLPWTLHDGVRVDVALAGWTPLQGSLGLGWLTVLLAMVAAALLVRGVLRMSERRAAFVSSVTHELRTPLTTFQLYSDLLAEGMVPDHDKRQSYLETMRSEAGRLNHLIENVLSYSRIERGSARARRERLSLADLVRRFEERLCTRTAGEQARFEVNGLEEHGEVVIDTDVTAVEQIIFNLVDNACKYGMPEEGEGIVRLSLSANRKRAGLSVCDSGKGIRRGDHQKLFRPFHKSAHDAAETKPGVGLGLALCRRLARALGGELTVDSKRDQGACFVLHLPRTNGA